jgi:thiol-disulfide isomerase/thioredoxin
MKQTILRLLCLVALVGCTAQKSYYTKEINNKKIVCGRISLDELKNEKEFPWYCEGVNAYKPNVLVVNELKQHVTGLGVIIFAGSWCSDTHENLPKMIKVLQEMGVKSSQIEVIMLDYNKQSQWFNASIFNITNVPTFVFFKNGQTIGKIVEQFNTNAEQDLLEILQ